MARKSSISLETMGVNMKKAFLKHKEEILDGKAVEVEYTDGNKSVYLKFSLRKRTVRIFKRISGQVEDQIFTLVESKSDTKSDSEKLAA